MSASMIESSMKVTLPGLAKGINAAADINESMATGPVCNWLDEPQSDATITGTNEA